MKMFRKILLGIFSLILIGALAGAWTISHNEDCTPAPQAANGGLQAARCPGSARGSTLAP